MRRSGWDIESPTYRGSTTWGHAKFRAIVKCLIVFMSMISYWNVQQLTELLDRLSPVRASNTFVEVDKRM